MWRCWRPAASRPSRPTPAICRSGSSPEAWRPMRSSASCCCSATSWPGRCSRSTRRTSSVSATVLWLRDVLPRSLFEKYQKDFKLLNRVLDAYEPAANRIANTVAVTFVRERGAIIRHSQDAIRELSTPVLQVRERILILPIIGVLDEQRANQFTEQLLAGIRDH